MPNNDIDIKNWKELDIDVNSLWILPGRTKTGKHQNVYHGNFIPQIPNQLLRRYTKKHQVVLDVFMGSGTTLFECERLERKFIGFDINETIIDYVKKQMQQESIFSYKEYSLHLCDSSNKKDFDNEILKSFINLRISDIDFIFFHPPYYDIIKFTDKEEDLSNCKNIDVFINNFINVVHNSYKYLKKNRYFALVIGDIYKNSEVIPLSFYLSDEIKKRFKVKLKGIIIKNIEGNRGKIGKNDIWKYRALQSDYFIFKHEYIFIFKKDE